MPADRITMRYRKAYALLLRLYPEPFRSRFAEGMEQTFNDLCVDRQDEGRGLLTFVPGLFAEALAGILRERMSLIMPVRKNLIRLAIVTAALLAIPLVAMQFTDEVQWNLFDFVVAAVLLFGAGLGFLIVAKKGSSPAYRGATALAVLSSLFLVWANLAVGLIGSEEHPANLLYLGVLLVGIVGAFASGRRPEGMARTLYAMAIVQAIVPLVALLIWRPHIADAEAGMGLAGVFVVNAFFIVLFLASGFLFRSAGSTVPARS